MIPVSFLDHILTLIPTTLAALAALIASIRNSRKLNDIHISLNGRLDELLRSNKLAAHAEGRQEERNQQSDKAAARAEGRQEERDKSTNGTTPTSAV